MFAALKLLQQDIGRVHIAADIGCHSFASFEPFTSGHTILGYGMSLASRAGVSPVMRRRDARDHGRRRLLAQRSALRRAVGAVQRRRRRARHPQERLHVGDRHAGNHFDAGRGAQGARAGQAREPRPYQSSRSSARSRASACGGCATSTAIASTRCGARCTKRSRPISPGSRSIIAEGECQLERQRRVKPWLAGASPRRASARCASSTASTRTSARATTRASGFPAARRCR